MGSAIPWINTQCSPGGALAGTGDLSLGNARKADTF